MATECAVWSQVTNSPANILSSLSTWLFVSHKLGGEGRIREERMGRKRMGEGPPIPIGWASSGQVLQPAVFRLPVWPARGCLSDSPGPPAL